VLASGEERPPVDSFSGFCKRPFEVPVASSDNVTGLVIIDFLRR